MSKSGDNLNDNGHLENALDRLGVGYCRGCSVGANGDAPQGEVLGSVELALCPIGSGRLIAFACSRN